MKEVKTIQIRNGDMYEPYRIYKCECCDKDIEEAWPREVTADGIYCGDCAFKNGYISSEKYIKKYLFFIDACRAEVHDGEIYITTRKSEKFPWEKTNKSARKTTEYKTWREKVFERDNYTCQSCGQIGGELNAHHIKPFAQYEALRYDINNGVTLCKECHKEIHRK